MFFITNSCIFITTTDNYLGRKKMAESLSIRLQPQTVDTVEEIVSKRLSENGIKDSKTRVIAEAVQKLAKEELNG